jgi:hypothetical protein
MIYVTGSLNVLFITSFIDPLTVHST